MYHIFGFYKFKKLKKLSKYKEVLNNFFLRKNIRGTLIISSEGINGNISGKKKDLNLAISKIQKTFNFTNFDNKNVSINTFQPFHRSKIKIKNEVVPMGIKIKNRKTDGHLSPKKWNQLICDKNTILIDDYIRNTKEFSAKGGIGIRHKTTSQTISELKKLGL